MASQVPQDDDLIASINITPMVDIVLVLLIIFMVTTNLLKEQAIEIELPEAATGKEVQDTLLGVTIDSLGRWYLNGQPIDDAGLRVAIRGEKAKGPELQVLISADRAVPHGEVIRVIDLVKQEGVRKFALNTDPPPAPPPAAPVL